MLLDRTSFPPDPRVENEARALLAAGHSVVVLCDQLDGRETFEDIEGIPVHRIPRPAWKDARVHRLVSDLSFFDLRWYRALNELHGRYAFDALHVHDLPMARTAGVVSRRCGIPLVLDLHENFPVALRSWRPARLPFGLHLRRRWNRNLQRWKRYERAAARRADRVIVVADEARDRVIALGVPPSRVAVVGNTLHDRFDAEAQDVPGLEGRFEGRFLISYFGSLGRYRRIDTVIRAMPGILQGVPDAHFLVVGQVEARPECRDLARELGVADRVTFESWKPAEQMRAYMRICHLGLLPHAPDEHTNNTLPHKLFQYMHVGVPVVVSECAPLRRIVEAESCGVVVPGMASSADRLAGAVIALARDEETRRDMGRRGRASVSARYRWSLEAERLNELYQALDIRR